MADPGTATDRQQHQLADLEVAHLRPQFLDAADAFISANRWQWRQHAVLAGQGEHVGWIDRCGLHLDPYLARRQCRQLQLDGFDHVLRNWTTGLVFGFEHDCSPVGDRRLGGKSLDLSA
ncbi:hypothetical protein D9M68_928330 [compost metagenome]